MTAKPSVLDELTVGDATLAVCQQVLLGVTQADLDRPTPCTDYDVAGLADHLVGSLDALAGMVGVEITRGNGASVEARVADAGQQTMEAWHRHGLDGMVKHGDERCRQPSRPPSCRWSCSSTPGTSPRPPDSG